MVRRTFTIDRSKWRSGGHESSALSTGLGICLLLNEEGFMCCLGHIATQCGFSDRRLRRVCMPCDVIMSKAESSGFLTLWHPDCPAAGPLAVSTRLAENAAVLNDDNTITTKERERRLTKLFAVAEVDLVFTGEPVHPNGGSGEKHG